MQDIVPRGSRTVRRIEKPIERIVEKPLVEEVEDVDIVEEIEQIEEVDSDKEIIRSVREEFEQSAKKARSRRRMPRFGKKKLFIGGGIIAMILLTGFITSMFRGATLTITPRTITSVVQNDYTAKKNSATELGYQVLTVKGTGSETVRANGEKQVDKRATGTIVIYNNYNATPQRLIKNTRFATPEGLIFRISDSVTVPGKKDNIPGSVEAVVVADEAGTKYNVGLKDFTIPGFKGDPRYTTFYARSKTALAGGFSGVQKIVAEADRAKAKANIENKLIAELTKQIIAQKGDSNVFFAKAYVVDFKELPEEAVGDAQVSIKEEATVSAVLFNVNALTSVIARANIKDYKDIPIAIRALENLAFAPKGEFKPVTGDSVSFTLAGSTTFEWLFDEGAVKKAFLGQSRANVQTILQKFPMIQSVGISLTPFWARTLPVNPEKITIKKA